MKIPVIVDAVRTPMGKSKNGIYRNIRAEKLSTHVINSIFERNENISKNDVNEVIFGCVNQQKEQGFNIARFASLGAELPVETTAKTINFLCGSSLEAINDAARQIMIGEGNCYVCGGIEHMGHIPMDSEYDENPEYCLTSSRASQVMGYTAEYLFAMTGISRREQDEFALRSHVLASQADWSGEIVPTPAHSPSGAYTNAEEDEPVRKDTNIDQLGNLNPVFNPQGTVTAGNSSAISDGASALLIMEKELALEKGFSKSRLIEIKGFCRTGVSPSVMGLAPISAVTELLSKSVPDISGKNYNLEDIGLIELNEAFSIQALACLDGLDLIDEIDTKINLKGGAIALGHPLGCSGARITTTLFHLMHEEEKDLGISTMCVGMGQGVATLLKKCE